MLNILALLAAIAAATIFGALAGWFFERVIVRPVYKDHLRQILITIGALILTSRPGQPVGRALRAGEQRAQAREPLGRVALHRPDADPQRRGGVLLGQV